MVEHTENGSVSESEDELSNVANIGRPRGRGRNPADSNQQRINNRENQKRFREKRERASERNQQQVIMLMADLASGMRRMETAMINSQQAIITSQQNMANAMLLLYEKAGRTILYL
jgi:hypothetical protein